MNNKNEVLSDKQITNLTKFLKKINYKKLTLFKDQINRDLDIENFIENISSEIFEEYDKAISIGQAKAILKRILGLILSSTDRSQLYELRKKIKKYKKFITYFGEFGKTFDYILKVLILGLEEDQANKLNFVLEKSKISPGKDIIGVDFYTKLVENYDKSLVNLQIWDISNHKKFGTIRNQYYRGAIVAILTFDKSNRESFELIKKYCAELKEKTNLQFNIKRLKGKKFRMPIALVGLGGDSVIPYDEIYNLAKEFDAQYFEMLDVEDDSFKQMLINLTYQVATRIQQG
jgi:GTPase SAR1 family protein